LKDYASVKCIGQIVFTRADEIFFRADAIGAEEKKERFAARAARLFYTLHAGLGGRIAVLFDMLLHLPRHAIF